jgi:hypothetical protein
MNEVVSAIRAKYPQYDSLDDNELTLAIASKYPVYLGVKSFADDVSRLKNGPPVAPQFRPSAQFAENEPDVAAGESPLKTIGRGLTITGKGAVAALADAGDMAVSDYQKELAKSGITDPVIGSPVEHPAGENLKAFVESGGEGRLPAEDLRTLPTPFQIAGRAAQGLIESTPKLAVVTAAQAAGVPAPVSAGAVFGLTPEGFDTKSAVIAAALPFVGKYSGEIAATLAKKAGMSSVDAINAVKGIAGTVGPAAGLVAEQEAEISKLPKGEQKQARIDMWANIAGQAALGPMGVEFENKGEPNAIPERSAEKTSVEESPGNSQEVGEGISEPEKASDAQKTENALSENEQAALDLVGQRHKPIEQRGPGGGNISTLGFLDPATYKPLIDAAAPYVKKSAEAVVDIGKEALNVEKMDDERTATLDWSAKLQRSFGEADKAQREIKSAVKDAVRRDAITNWIQAGGDKAVLQSRAAASKTPELKAGYEAAANLSPEELAVAQSIQKKYGDLFNRGQFYDVLNSFRDNYVTQVWDLGKGKGSGVSGSSRTLKDKFKFNRARVFDSFFDGEQAGFVPKTKDISKLLPIYMHEMESVIAARQLAEAMSRGKASDGRPLAVPRGVGVPVSGAGSKATLVMPRAIKGDTLDYKTIESQPALTDWRWVSKDSEGNPVFLKADLALHPEAYARLKNVLGRSAIREWYESKGSALASIPKALVRGIDFGQGEVKRTMLGLFAPFHQVQEATHAVGHRINPVFNVPKIDLSKPEQMDAARHGLMLLPDRASQNSFMEGFRHSGIVSRIPILGPAADWYSHYLFHEYIPGLKFKTYDAILNRNLNVYSKELASGAVTPSDVKALSAEQANAAYGHLNYADLARNPTIQHLMQLGLLAPDFLEARARFLGQSLKGVTGAKAGREQLLALGTLALAQAATAFTAAQLTGGKWDPKNPFTFVNGNRRYTLRSVPEDAYRLLADSRAFIYARLNPLVGHGAVQYLSGVDWRGQKKTALETTKELAQQPIPITLRPLLGVGNTPLSMWEQLLGAVGLKIGRYSAQTDVRNMVDKFKRDSGNAKLIAEAERQAKEVHADSDYKPLREALVKGDQKEAVNAYQKLLETKTPLMIEKAMRPFTTFRVPGTDYFGSHNKAFTGSVKVERAFVKSLSPEDKKTYDEAVGERRAIYNKFREMRKAHGKP